MNRFSSLLVGLAVLAACAPKAQKCNLVPETPSGAPDYLCTWNLQCYRSNQDGSVKNRAEMVEENFFGDGPYQGWASLYPAIREDLFLVLDDSWDNPRDRNERDGNPYYGTVQLDTTRFPSFKGAPAQRLKALSDRLTGMGWKGVGGWICAEKARTSRDVPDSVYWPERLREAQEGGIRYWKVDWGEEQGNGAWRKQLSQWGREYAPDLTIEHAMNPAFIAFSDTYRTYDVENITAQTVTIDRVAQYLAYAPEAPALGIINCEDEPYIAAGLGCAIGIMRHPFTGALPSGRADIGFPESGRNLKRRLDEVVRGVRWHRIAQPFGSDGVSFSVDTLILEDGWKYRTDESWIWHEDGDTVWVSAPARVSRNMPLPKVGSEDPARPFVLASRYPGGAVAVATVGRSLGREYVLQEVPVEIEVPDLASPVGVFGRYGSLTLRYPYALGKVRVLAQDLAAHEAVDITGRVKVEGNKMTVPGSVIAEVGLSAASEGDVSDPGLVLKLERLPGNAGPKAAWGDTEDGYYRNPVLLADYSDPDAIRVGDRYYMVASDFHFMGMQVLESADLVNWKIISQIYSRLDYPGWDANEHYAGGSWAPSIRWHDGLFYVYFCTPDEGLFMSTASDPAGPWAPLHCVKAAWHWEDPCPFWDEDGQAYLGHSVWGAGPIIIHRMSPDGRELLDEGVTVYRGPVAEGTKIHKWNGLYYMSIPEGGVGGGWQTVLRSRNIYGPYERKVVLERGSTPINGPHQGAIVDTPEGAWWFLHFQERNPLGRVVHLQPMHWEEGWPVMGEDFDGNGIGEPVACWEKPVTARTGKRVLPASSDDFQGEKPGLQWQFNHNPQDDGWSLSRREGFLALDGLQADSFWKARNTLTQKLMGYRGTYTVGMDLSDLSDGQRAGLACMGASNYCVGIRQVSGQRELFLEKDGAVLDSLSLKAEEVWLRLSFDAEAREGGFSFLYSLDGKRFDRFGEAFAARNGYWNGARPALFSYNTERKGGTAWFRDFVYVEEK